ETPDMQGEINLVWKYILPAFAPGKLPADKTSAKSLKTRLASLALTPPVSPSNAAMEQQLTGKTYTMISNDRRLQKVTSNFAIGKCTLVLQTDSVEHQLNFGPGKWLYNETQKFGPYLVAGARANRVGLPPFKIAGSYSWKDDKTVEFILRYIESPHHEVI